MKRGGEIDDFTRNFQSLEYIESTGTQWIDTGVQASSSIGFEATFLTNNSLGTSGFGVIFGAKNSPDFEFQLITYSSTGGSGFFYYGANGETCEANLVTGQKLNVSYDAVSGVYKTDFGTENVKSAAYSSSLNITLFACNTSNGPVEAGKVKLYAFKLYDNGNLVRDFVPCRRNYDGAVGLYDRVSRQFFGNAGTGTFIAGGGAQRLDMDVLMAGFNAKTSSAAAMTKNNDGSYTWGGPTGCVGGESSGGLIIVPYALENGVYRLSYDAVNPRSDGNPTTALTVVDKNGVYLGGFVWKNGESQSQDFTFVVGDNFGGFHIGWFYGDRATFRNIFLEKIG